jgi:thiol-disulfide isomerase/thioredoxin
MPISAAVLAAALTFAPIANAAAPWLNAERAPAVAGRVTVVDVFTFWCINCRHVVPELQRLHAEIPARELQIVGIHAPETPYERLHANVRNALREQGITWPVVFDDDFRLWNAYGVDAWPTQLVFDRRGQLRARFVGEGLDAKLEATVKALIAESR